MNAESYFDHETAMTYCGGDEDMFKICLGIYAEQGVEYLEQIPKLVAAQDYDQYRILVHAIKSTSKQVGALDISEKAKEQELFVKDGRIDDVNRTWQQLLTEYKQVLTAAAELAEE